MGCGASKPPAAVAPSTRPGLPIQASDDAKTALNASVIKSAPLAQVDSVDVTQKVTAEDLLVPTSGDRAVLKIAASSINIKPLAEETTAQAAHDPDSMHSKPVDFVKHEITTTQDPDPHTQIDLTNSGASTQLSEPVTALETIPGGQTAREDIFAQETSLGDQVDSTPVYDNLESNDSPQKQDVAPMISSTDLLEIVEAAELAMKPVKDLEKFAAPFDCDETGTATAAFPSENYESEDKAHDTRVDPGTDAEKVMSDAGALSDKANIDVDKQVNPGEEPCTPEASIMEAAVKDCVPQAIVADVALDSNITADCSPIQVNINSSMSGENSGDMAESVVKNSTVSYSSACDGMVENASSESSAGTTVSDNQKDVPVSGAASLVEETTPSAAHLTHEVLAKTEIDEEKVIEKVQPIDASAVTVAADQNAFEVLKSSIPNIYQAAIDDSERETAFEKKVSIPELHSAAVAEAEAEAVAIAKNTQTNPAETAGHDRLISSNDTTSSTLTSSNQEITAAGKAKSVKGSRSLNDLSSANTSIIELSINQAKSKSLTLIETKQDNTSKPTGDKGDISKQTSDSGKCLDESEIIQSI